MRKLILGLAGLLVSASVCYAAFFMPQTYLPSAPTRVQKDLVTDYGATCDAQTATRVVTITNSGSGLRDLAVTVNTFASGDVGKRISIPGAANGGNVFSTTIATFVDAQHITLGTNVDVALSSASSTITWGTDATSAFATFKAAFQGTTPVQLNLPGNCAYAAVGGAATQFPFMGIADLILAGNGKATSGFYSVGNGNPLFGGRGQFQDNAHSLRTNDANAGDSCVTIKTTPAVTVSAIGGSLSNPAVFTASSSGTTMTVTAVASGTIAVGTYLGNEDSNISGWTSVVSQLTGPAGGTGTYSLSASNTFSSQRVVSKPVSFTASVATTGVMTVSAIQDGSLSVGMFVYGIAGGLPNIVTVKSQLTGSAGSTGTYQLDSPPQSSIASSQFQGNGQMRVTLNSTTGLSSGDTLYLTGITGRGVLPQRVNGLRWVKVVNGTQVDLFLSDYDGSYTSGGTGAGDRTSLTPAGSEVLMTGWTNQAYWGSPFGYPSNPHWFEFRTVLSTNSTTHQVCFTSPLSNSYKASWPQMSTGNQFEVDPGGPATLYALDSTWELTHVYKDLTLAVNTGQTTANGRNITWDNVKLNGGVCAIPTQNETHTWNNVDASTCIIETDKIVGTWNITGGSIFQVDVQSSAMDTINVSGTTVDKWFGVPKKLTMTNTTVACAACATTDPALSIGTPSYGVDDEAVFSNVTVSKGYVTVGTGSGVGMPSGLWSMASGVITIPNALNTGSREIQTRYMAPDHYNFWFGLGGGGTSAQVGRSLKIVSVSQDTDNTYITTSEAGGFPTGTAWTTAGLNLISHPAPKLTASFALGSVNSALVFNGCPAQAPMYSCGNFTYTGSATGGSVAQFGPTLWGTLDTFTFTNNVPYTGGGALGFTLSQNANWQILKTDLTTTTFGVLASSGGQINVKLPSSGGGGTRTLTPSGATGTQSLDSLTAPTTGALFGGANLPIFSANTPSDSPQVTVTLRTNQSLP